MMLMKNSFRPTNKFLPGQIVLIKFPFTDLSGGKIRPALVICSGDNEDVLLAPISSTVKMNRLDLRLSARDFYGSPLPIESCIRYNKLFTLNKRLILKAFSEITKNSLRKIKLKIIEFIKKY